MSVTIQPPGQNRITLAPWKTTISQKNPRKKPSTTPNLSSPAKTNIFHFLALPTHQIIKSASTTIQPNANPFDELPDMFPTTKNLEFPLLRPGMSHHIILKKSNAVWKLRNIRPKGKFLADILEMLRAEEKSVHVHRSEDISCCAMFVIPKMDHPSELRYIHDLVKRNKETELQPALIPSQSIIRNAVATHPFRSKIDISDGYHTIRVHPPYEKYTAFSTLYITYRTRVIQQGECHAPDTFQNIMNNLFKYVLGICVHIYIDDIFIFSKTYKEHLHHVRTVLQRLRENNFYANKEKPQFMPSVLQFWGHVITWRGISPTQKSVQKILDWPQPQNRKILQQYMGMVNYLGHLIPHLADMAAPLTEMAGAIATWDWTPTLTKAFNYTKTALSTDPAVRPINYYFADQIYLVADASLIGTGAWIGQGPTLQTIIPADFHSRKFNPAQENYSTFDKELLNIVDALKHIRSELTRCSFIILTDHKPLVSSPTQYDLTGKQYRWQQIIPHV